MEYLIILLLFFFIAVTIVVNVLYRQAKKHVNAQLFVQPHLGIQEIAEEKTRNQIIQIINQLEVSFPPQFVESVRERVLREQKINLIEWDNRWFEWKRYFLLYCLAPGYPMPSREVDVIWHEMFQFKKDYEKFCQNFAGRVIERPDNPSTKKISPHDRAWFDLLYITLFRPTPFSEEIWGPFLKNALSHTMVSDWTTKSRQELEEKYFSTESMNHAPELRVLGGYLIKTIQQKFRMVKEHVERYEGDLNKFRYNRKLQPYDANSVHNKLMGVIFLSMVHQERFPEMYYLLYIQSESEEINTHTDHKRPPTTPPPSM